MQIRYGEVVQNTSVYAVQSVQRTYRDIADVGCTVLYITLFVLFPMTSARYLLIDERVCITIGNTAEGDEEQNIYACIIYTI